MHIWHFSPWPKKFSFFQRLFHRNRNSFQIAPKQPLMVSKRCTNKFLVLFRQFPAHLTLFAPTSKIQFFQWLFHSNMNSFKITPNDRELSEIGVWTSFWYYLDNFMHIWHFHPQLQNPFLSQVRTCVRNFIKKWISPKLFQRTRNGLKMV